MSKNFILFVLGFITFTASAQDTKVWRVGIQFGSSGNSSSYSGGMSAANARFNHSLFQAPNIDLVARYDFNKHLMLMTGIGVNDIGFGYSISENYSLAEGKLRSSDLKTDFVALEFPLMLYYKFKPNCKNVGWVVGGGYVTTLLDQQTIEKDFSSTAEGNSTNYLSSQSTSNGGGSVLIRWSIGREKTFVNGSILQASFMMNMGFNTLASSTVNYTLDNQNYSHTFSNSGSSVGFRLAYFLKPFTTHSKPGPRSL